MKSNTKSFKDRITNILVTLFFTGFIGGVGVLIVSIVLKPLPLPDYKAKLLLTYDGCKVYSFVDGGNTNYFARCPESVATTYQANKSTKNIITEKK